jgi:Asp-tRNA(Asn)/Glu-tRNA(Gln) amidotransferase A subunit family amidase
MYHGANVGLQLIGRRFQEEKILAVADVVDRLLKANRST